MNIKIDMTEVTVFSEGQILNITVPSLETQKSVTTILKNYFGDSKFKILELKRNRNILIPVVDDSVTQSVSEYFDSAVIIEPYPDKKDELSSVYGVCATADESEVK